MQTIPKTRLVYDILRDRTRHTSDDAKTDDVFLQFNDPRFHDTEYWLYSDLHSLYGDKHFNMQNMYADAYQKMKNAISDIWTLEPSFDDVFHAHVTQINTPYDISPDALYQQSNGKSGPDLKLTRFAAWALTKHSRITFFARMFFLFYNTTFDNIGEQTIRYSRIRLHHETLYLNHVIQDLSQQYGGDASTCHKYINQAFFYGIDTARIKQVHHLPDNPRTALTDYLTANALSAYNSALRTAINEFNATPHKTTELLYDLLYTHMTDARVALIKKTDKGPENNIDRKRISKLEDKLKSQERQLIKQSLKTKLK